MRYAGFWRRLGALIIDLLIVFPVGGLSLAFPHSRTWRLLLPLPVFLIGTGYNVYFHARWGQTLGKMATGIQVVTVDGGRIGWTRALRRYSVDLLFGLLSVIGGMFAVSAVPATDFASLGWLELSRRIDAQTPRALAWALPVGMVWTFSEVVVMLFNARKRALHDFIAGTVVIVKQSGTSPGMTS